MVALTSPLAFTPDTRKFVDDSGRMYLTNYPLSVESSVINLDIPKARLAHAVDILENDLFDVYAEPPHTVTLKRTKDIFEVWVTNNGLLEPIEGAEEFHVEGVDQKAFRFERARLVEVFRSLRNAFAGVIRFRNVTLNQELKLSMPLVYLIQFS